MTTCEMASRPTTFGTVSTGLIDNAITGTAIDRYDDDKENQDPNLNNGQEHTLRPPT